MTTTPGAVQGILEVGARKHSTRRAMAPQRTTTLSTALLGLSTAQKVILGANHLHFQDMDAMAFRGLRVLIATSTSMTAVVRSTGETELSTRFTPMKRSLSPQEGATGCQKMWTGPD